MRLRIRSNQQKKQRATTNGSQNDSNVAALGIQAVPTPKKLSLSETLIALVNQHGSPEERRLVSTHEPALRAFLDHPDINLQSKKVGLDIGIENQCILKLNHIASPFGSAWGLIDWVCDTQPKLRALGELVLQHKIRCHVGMKLTSSEAEFELYPYETESHIIRDSLFADHGIDNCKLPVSPYCYGLTSEGVLSAYASMDNVPAEELEAALGGSRLPHQGLRNKALFHSRRSSSGTWSTDKAGIEFLPFPSHMLNAALSKASFNFSYLIHRGGNRPYGVIGAKDSRRVLYTTLLPILQGQNR